MLYGAFVLNAPLLKSRGFKYEGYPYNGCNGQKAHGEDIDLLYYCYANNIKTLKINNLHIVFDKEHQSIAWGDLKNKEKMMILTYIWLLGKYKDYPKITTLSKNVIDVIINNLKYHSSEELYDVIVNEVSEETLNKFIGEEKMKKMLIGGLVLMMMAGLFTGCPEKPEEEEESGEDKIAAEYQGKFTRKASGMDFYITLTKDQIIFSQKNGNNPETTQDTLTAWTDGNDLWANVKRSYAEQYVDGKPQGYYGEKLDYKLGTFTDQNTISVRHYLNGGGGNTAVNFTRVPQNLFC